MQRKSFVITAALVLGLTLGVVFGPALRGSSASAQTGSGQSQTTSPVDSLRNLFLDKLAAALNIQRPALDSAIQSAGNSTADEALAQGLLTQPQADHLRGHLQNGDFGPFFGGRGGRGGRLGGPGLPGVREAMLDAAAQTLNITRDQLIAELRSGQTLAQVATAHGSTEQSVITAALAAARTQLDQAVAAGTLTEAQADEAYARLEQAGTLPLGKGGRGHRGWQGAPGAPATPSAPTATPSAEA